jgi:peptidyl-tRNA hydrolase
LVLLSPEVEMSAGKAMAQAGHAAQLGWRSLPRRRRARWQLAGFPLAVRTASSAQWRGALTSGAPVVHDAGFTEVAPNSQTAAIVF